MTRTRQNQPQQPTPGVTQTGGGPHHLPTFRVAATVKAVIELTNSGHVGGAELVAAFVRLQQPPKGLST